MTEFCSGIIVAAVAAAVAYFFCRPRITQVKNDYSVDGLTLHLPGHCDGPTLLAEVTPLVNKRLVGATYYPDYLDGLTILLFEEDPEPTPTQPKTTEFRSIDDL